jgi:hypothetical protein
VSVIRQLSLFGAEASAPEPGDLAGVLAAGGQITQLDAGAQLSVTVDHPWRAANLVAECARRAVAATSLATPAEHIAVRTVHSELLVPLAQRWLTPAGVHVPRDLRLDARMLRLWVLAGGRRSGDTSYLLPAGPTDEPGREMLGAALAGLGLAAQLAVARGLGAAMYRIVGKRRLDRLVELVGDPPKQPPADIWPS